MTVTTAASPPPSASPHDLWYDTGNGNRRNECTAAVTWQPSAVSGWAGTSALGQPGAWPDGTPALLLTADGTGVSGWQATSPSQPVTAGQVVSAQAAVAVPFGGTALGEVALSIAWYNSSATLISTTSGTGAAVAASAETAVSVSGTAPAGAVSFTVQPGDLEDSAAGAQLLVSTVTAGTWTAYELGTGSVAPGTSIPGAVDNTTIVGAMRLNYGGTPGPGELNWSTTGRDGTDQYGNAYLAGITSYALSGSTYQAASLAGGVLQLATASAYGGPYTTEAWHSVPPPSGASGVLRYQAVASPPSCMLVQAQLTFSPAVSGTVSLWTFGSGSPYIPVNDFREPAGCGAAGMATLEITTGGVVQALNVPSGTTEIDFCKTVPLN